MHCAVPHSPACSLCHHWRHLGDVRAPHLDSQRPLFLSMRAIFAATLLTQLGAPLAAGVVGAVTVASASRPRCCGLLVSTVLTLWHRPCSQVSRVDGWIWLVADDIEFGGYGAEGVAASFVRISYVRLELGYTKKCGFTHLSSVYQNHPPTHPFQKFR